jgi:hypothetical protein
MELLEGLKARLDLLGADDPEMVTVDNCCAVRKKILEVFPQLKILLDVYHFLMRSVDIFLVCATANNLQIRCRNHKWNAKSAPWRGSCQYP